MSVFRKFGSNQLLIWESIRKACCGGARWFDFGRTHVAHSTLIEFKQRWGAEERVILDYCGVGKAPTAFRVSAGKKIIYYINRGMPNLLLDWQGALVYRFLN